MGRRERAGRAIGFMVGIVFIAFQADEQHPHQVVNTGGEHRCVHQDVTDEGEQRHASGQRGCTESAWFIMPYTSQGARPTSVTNQPVSTAKKGAMLMARNPCRNQRAL